VFRSSIALLALLLAACAAPQAYEEAASFAAGEDPTGIAAGGERIYVAEARAARIRVHERDGRLLDTFGEAHLRRPMHLSLHHGRLYVADFFEDAVFVFDTGGELLETWRAQDGLDAPGGAVPWGGGLAVADTYGHRVVRIAADGETRTLRGRRGEAGRFGARMRYPGDVAALADGGLVLADSYSHRLVWLDRDGNRLRSRGGPFTLAPGVPAGLRGWFNVVSSVAARPDGGICAADFFNGRVQCFDARGRLDAVFGAGVPRTAFGVAVAPDGGVYVTDVEHGRVRHYVRVE
jgi:DNA-binding beta-propeller fold protein YncE